MQANSAELLMADWIAQGDALHHQAAALQQESRETLDAVLAELQALGEESKSRRPAIEKAIEDLERDWTRVDEQVMELVARATDEIATFVTAQEVRVRTLDRHVRREHNHTRLCDVSNQTGNKKSRQQKKDLKRT